MSGIAQSVYRWATGWMDDVRFPAGAIDYFLTASRPALGSHSASYPMGTGSKAAERKDDQSLPFISEVENSGDIPPLPYTSSYRGA
jgi:hypothetical protein